MTELWLSESMKMAGALKLIFRCNYRVKPLPFFRKVPNNKRLLILVMIYITRMHFKQCVMYKSVC